MKILYVILAVLASLTGTCLAQGKSTTKKEQQTKSQPANIQPAQTVIKQASTKEPVIKFSMGMLESGRIDPRYTGFSAAEVIAAVEKITGTKKGEFETTADYNARKAAARTAKFLGDSSVEDIFAFTVSVEKVSKDVGGLMVGGLKYEFNADTGDVSLYVLPKPSDYLSLNGVGAPDSQTDSRERRGLDQLELSSKIESQSTYQASNAYGATVTVKKISKSSAGIAANRIPFLKFERKILYRNPTVATQFKMDNAKAAAELPRLKALIVMKLSEPYLIYNFYHEDPTRNSPLDFSIQEKFLTGDVLGIIFYSGLSGEIVARLPETFGIQ